MGYSENQFQKMLLNELHETNRILRNIATNLSKQVQHPASDEEMKATSDRIDLLKSKLNETTEEKK